MTFIVIVLEAMVRVVLVIVSYYIFIILYYIGDGVEDEVNFLSSSVLADMPAKMKVTTAS